MKTISIIAATLSGNRGAEAMLTTTIGRIRDRHPDAVFNIYSYYPKSDRALVSDPRVNIFSATPVYLVTLLLPCSVLLAFFKRFKLNFLSKLIPGSVRALDVSDVLIDLAGVAFIDGREKFLPYNVLTLTPALLLDTPVIKFSQASGPFNNPLNHLLAKQTLSKVNKVFARGASTHQHLRSLALDTDYDEPVADVAFLHRPDDTITHENEGRAAGFFSRLEAEPKELIGICPSSVLAAKSGGLDSEYHQQIARLCSQLMAQGYAVLLYPNATREGEMSKLRNNDLPVIAQIVKHLDNDTLATASLYFIDFDINTQAIKRLMSYCKLVMVSRFHAMIAALAGGQPVIVLGWSHKYLEVMDSFGLGDLVYDFSQFDSEVILSTIRHTLENESAIREKIESHKESVKASAYKQFDYLFDLLDQY